MPVPTPRPPQPQRSTATQVAGWLGLALLACAAAACGASGPNGFGGELEFTGEREFIPNFEHDSGWVPADSPAAIRVVATASGTTEVRARATTDGSSLIAVTDSGELSSSGGFEFELRARIDAAGFEYQGVVESFTYEVDPATTTFEPFLLEDSTEVTHQLPPQELGSVPIPSIPGSTLVFEVTGGEITTAFEGTCAQGRDGVGQYTGEATTSGEVDLAGTIEIDVPFLGSESFGPFEVTIPLPEVTGAMDLGARALDTGAPVEGSTVCSEDGDTDTQGSVSTTSGTPTTTGSASTSTTSSGTTTAPTSSSGVNPEATGTTDWSGSAESSSTSAQTETSSTMGEPADPYAEPNPGCPGDGVPIPVQVDGEIVVQICAPLCSERDPCPDPSSGTVEPSCVPLALGPECQANIECAADQQCLDGFCATVQRYCILFCDGDCPDGMSCGVNICGYP